MCFINNTNEAQMVGAKHGNKKKLKRGAYYRYDEAQLQRKWW